MPPSITYSVPVIEAARDDARNATRSATSLGFAGRPIGIHEQEGTYSGNLNLQVSLDGDRLLGRSGLTLFVDGLWIHGSQPSALLGDAQGVSNLSAPAKVTLYEAWLQYNVFGNKFSALVGRYDLNTEFYRVQAAGLFLNSSFGIGPGFPAVVRAGHRSSPVRRSASG